MDASNVIMDQNVLRRDRPSRAAPNAAPFVVPDNSILPRAHGFRRRPIDSRNERLASARAGSVLFGMDSDSGRPGRRRIPFRRPERPAARDSFMAPAADTAAKVVPEVASGLRGRLAALAKALADKLRALPRPWTVVPALGALMVVLSVAVIGSAGAFQGRVDLSGFALPDDGAIISIILESVSPESADDDEAAAPDLPLTLSMSTHAVAAGETLGAIAARAGIRLDTLISVNGIADVRRVQVGQVLKVPNMDGIAYTVKRGDSLGGIASVHGSTTLDLVDANDLSSQTIRPGQALFIPGARLDPYDLKKALGTLVAWPVKGRISSYFGYRPNPFTGVRQFHTGIDIVAPENTPARAAMDGRVSETGYSAIFGNFVILSHSGGYQTLYGHLNSIAVRNGQSIAQGDRVGLIGSTGYSTGVHLHFGVYKKGSAVDPAKLLANR